VGTVVGVALYDGLGRVLAGRRRDGGWEFPGGKVERGERQRVAAVRECAEELGVRVVLSRRLPGAQPCGNGYTLYVWAGRILAGRPRALDHAELRWVAAAELPHLDWLAPDIPFLLAVREGLGR
jgi:8-oxo-dGTP diphosphatase